LANTSGTHPLQAVHVQPKRRHTNIPVNPPRARWRAPGNNDRDSLHPSAAPLVLIVGGDLGKHLMETPLVSVGVQTTRERSAIPVKR
jgi:hypothetical protein